MGCGKVELAQGIEVPQQVLPRATSDLVRPMTDQGSGLGVFSRQAGQDGRKVDLTEQSRDAGHLSCGKGSGRRSEGTNGMRVRVEEAEIDHRVPLGGLPKSIQVDAVETCQFADPYQHGRRPVQVQDVRRRRIPVGISTGRRSG